MGGMVNARSAEEVAAAQASVEEWIASGTVHDDLSQLLNGEFDSTLTLINSGAPKSHFPHYKVLASRIAAAESDSRRWQNEAERATDTASMAAQRQEDAERRAQFLEKIVTALQGRIDTVKVESESRIACLEERLQIAQDSQNFAVEQLVFERAATNEVAKALARGERDSAEATKALTQVTVQATKALSKILQESQDDKCPDHRDIQKDARCEINELRSKIRALEQEKSNLKKNERCRQYENSAMADEDLLAHRICIRNGEKRLRRSEEESLVLERQNARLRSENDAAQLQNFKKTKGFTDLSDVESISSINNEFQEIPPMLSDTDSITKEYSILKNKVLTSSVPLEENDGEEESYDTHDDSNHIAASDKECLRPQESNINAFRPHQQRTEYEDHELQGTLMELRKTAARLLSSDDTSDPTEKKYSDVDAARKSSFLSTDSLTENYDDQSMQARSVVSDDESDPRARESAPGSSWLPLSMAAIDETSVSKQLSNMTSRSDIHDDCNFDGPEFLRTRSHSEFSVHENGCEQSDASSSSSDMQYIHRVAGVRVVSRYSSLSGRPAEAVAGFSKNYDSDRTYNRLSPTWERSASAVPNNNKEREEARSSAVLNTYSAMKQAALREMESEWMKEASDLARMLRDRELSFYRRGLQSAREHQAKCDKTVTSLGTLTLTLMARGKAMADSLGERLSELEERIVHSYASNQIGNIVNQERSNEGYCGLTTRNERIPDVDNVYPAEDEALSQISLHKDDTAHSVRSCPPMRS